MTAPIESLALTGNGLRFAARSAGEGPLVLCLHGFPDSAHTFDDLLPALAADRWHAVAPFMRGYAPTQVPRTRDYHPLTLGRDVLALADALGARRFFIVGHDWGAIAAYAAAALAPERVRGLVTAAVPPLRRFVLNMRLRQLRRSWYIGFFQLPWIAEHGLARNDCALVERLWRDWSPRWSFREADIAPVKAILAQPASCSAALNYYRALPAATATPWRLRDKRRLFGRLAVPGLVIAGSDDGCIGPEMFFGTEACFTGRARLELLTAGHFMHREAPARFERLVKGFLRDTDTGSD